MKIPLFFGNTPRRPAIIVVLTAGPVFAGGWYLLGMVPPGWSLLQWGAFLLLTFDIIGGIFVNTTDSNQTYWKEQPMYMRMIFLGIHALQPALIVLAWDWWRAALLFAYMLVAGVTGFVLRGEARRMWLAGTCFAGMMLFRDQPPGMEWFVPAYLIKLLISYAMPHPGETQRKE